MNYTIGNIDLDELNHDIVSSIEVDLTDLDAIAIRYDLRYEDFPECISMGVEFDEVAYHIYDVVESWVQDHLVGAELGTMNYEANKLHNLVEFDFELY